MFKNKTRRKLNEERFFVDHSFSVKLGFTMFFSSIRRIKNILKKKTFKTRTKNVLKT